jgi:Flp pilus assembly pilin Flp
MNQTCSVKRNPEGGQGLTEYSLLLALIALVAVAVLVIFGPGVGNIYSEISNTFNGDRDEPVVEPAVEPVDVITIVRAEYLYGRDVHIDAQVNGGMDPDIELVASPGGVMQREPNHYHIYFDWPCPCEITITSSTGSSTTVMVGP